MGVASFFKNSSSLSTPHPPLLKEANQLGFINIPIDQTYALADVAEAHRTLEARKTTGCTILTL